MKTKILGFITALLVFTGSAIAGIPGNISGEVTGIKGDMVTIETTENKTEKFHVDPKTTKKIGNIEIGAQVTADVDAKGHAKSVTVVKNMKMDTDKKMDMGKKMDMERDKKMDMENR